MELAFHITAAYSLLIAGLLTGNYALVAMAYALYALGAA